MTKPYQDYTGAEILDLEFPSPPEMPYVEDEDGFESADFDDHFSYTFDDEEFDTIRDYLKGLLDSLWTQGEGFSGKRPFGNSGWRHDLYRPLIAAGFPAEDYEDMNDAIYRAIDAL